MLSKRIFSSFLPLFLVILVAIFLRFVFLDKVPNAIGGDEIVYVLNAKASFLTGHDIFGSWNPIQGLLFQYPKGEAQAELPYLLYAPIVGLLPFSLFAAHLPNAILGVLLVVFIYLVTAELLGKKAGVGAAAIAAINPWLIYIGRTAYEAIPASLFYFVSLYILLKAKGWRILIAFPFLVLSFYTYIATKLIFIPFVLIVSLYCFFIVNKKKYLKQYLVLFSLCVLFVLFYFVSLKLNPQTARLGELFTPNSSGVAEQVDSFRKTSLHTPISNILTNKYTVYVNLLATKTLKTFAADYLFVSGDEFFSMWRHGLFYYIDSLFLVIGLVFVFNRKKSIFALLGTLAIVGVIPQVMHTADISNFSPHASLMFPFLIILIGVGVFETINFFKNKNLRIITGIIVFLIYLISVANFFNIYTNWFPLQGYFDFPVRPVSVYAQRAAQNSKVTIYSNSSYDFFKKYLFYSNSLNKDTALQIRKNLNLGIYSIGNVTFKGCDNSLDASFHTDEIIIFQTRCGYVGKEKRHLSVSNLSDGGENFAIFNDKLCSKFSLGRYPQITSLNSFNMGNLSNQDFCKSFITSF